MFISVTKNLVQFLPPLTVCLGFLSYGIMLTWTSPMLPKLLAGNCTLRVTPDEGSWIVSAIFFGGLSAPLIGHMSNKFGRKPMLIATTIPLIANFIIILVATSPAHIIVARVIAGVGLASIYVIGPVYMGEVLHQQYRGMLGSMMDLFVNIGSLLTYCVGPYTSFTLYNGLCLIFPTLFVLMMMFMPETPYYLLMNNKRELAQVALSSLRNTSPQEIQKELDEMEVMVLEQTKNPGSLRALITNKASRRGLLVTVGLVMTLQFSGFMAISSYAQSIFDMVPGIAFTSSQCVIITGIVEVLSGMITVTLADRCGRRPLLMTSTLGCSFSLCVLATYLYLPDVSGYEWTPLTCLIVFIIMLCLGLSSLTYVIVGEVFPSNVKDLAVSISIMTSAMCSAIVTKIMQIMGDSIGYYSPFWLFSAALVCGFFFVYFLVPETKGKRFETIISELSGKQN